MQTKSFSFAVSLFLLRLRSGHRILIGLLSFSFYLLSLSSLAQTRQNDVTAASGGYANVANISIEYTIDEIATETLTTGSMILTQGFHQPFLTVTAIESIDMLKDIIVFPNPLAEMLSIDIPLSYEGMFTISLYDMKGRIMNTVSVLPGLNTIDMSSYAPASYLLVAMHKKSGRQHQSKIVKIR